MKTRYGFWRLVTGLVLAALLAAILANASTAEKTQKLHIAGAYAVGSDPYWFTLKCGAQAAAKSLGVDLTMEGPATADIPQEVATFNSLAVSKPDGMMLAPYSPTAFIASVQKAMASGIPVISVDGQLAKKVDYMTVHTTYSSAGKLFAQAVGAAMHGKGKLAIVAFSPAASDPVDGDRYVPGLKLLKAKYPSITVLPVQYAAADTAKTASIVSSLITGNPDPTAVYTTNGPEGAGAASAILAAHKTGKISLISFDATPFEVAGLKSGTFSSLVSQSPYLEGQKAVQELVAYLKAHPQRGPVTPAKAYFLPTPLLVLTKANVNTPLAKSFEYRTTCG